eukprot:TRINITY_DN2792_c0_g1_i1.p1 TRINITY_DN2792_c0_g1~~TRINITY_DN2792_c0_g1_i1.p1  ORF type:complete len:372 (-),score=39.61 TRINITY_DN2792_c0_g1_i1:80-1195(-)
MVSDTLWGYLAVAGSIVFFGSLGVPVKSKRVQDAKIDPFVFQLYFSLAVFLTSWLVLIYNDFHFVWEGIVGAALWVPASVLSFFVIKYLGLSVGQGIWCGFIIIVSFLWGAVVFPKQHPIGNLPLAIVALAVLVAGICALSFSNSDFVRHLHIPLISPILKCCDSPQDEVETLTINTKYQAIDPQLSNSIHYEPESSTTYKIKQEQGLQGEPVIHVSSYAQKVLGVFLALLIGVFAGSMMVPMTYVDEKYAIVYLVSFGIGVLGITPILTFLYFLVQLKVPEFHFRVAFIPGFVTGIIWSIGNFCSIYATKYLGLTVGYPLTQVALLVAGLWGVIVFREIRGGQPITFFFLSAGILLGGAAMLALFGGKSH